MSPEEIERFLSGLHYVEDPWTGRLHEPERRALPPLRRLGLHGAAALLGLALGTVLWRVFVLATTADGPILAAAQAAG